jgi:kelch-like protein 10
MCSGEKYNLTTNKWIQIPDMPDPCINFSTEVTDDMIFAVSRQQNATTMNTTKCCDEKSNKWIDARDMNICISGVWACYHIFAECMPLHLI